MPPSERVAEYDENSQVSELENPGPHTHGSPEPSAHITLHGPPSGPANPTPHWQSVRSSLPASA